MRISDWSSDVCSSDLGEAAPSRQPFLARTARARHRTHAGHHPRPPGRGDRGGAGGSGSMTGPIPTIALVGNPNAGKSSLFNALTGARQKIANYPGVTVERKAGHASFADGRPLALIDLPGSYSLSPASPAEAVTRDVVLGRQAGDRRTHALYVVVAAAHLDNPLRFAL